MKHSPKVLAIILVMFFLSQLIGLFVINVYSPKLSSSSTGELTNLTSYNLPYGMEPPSGISNQSSLFSIILALAIAIGLMFLLMHWKSEVIIRIWFFAVVTLAIAISVYSVLPKTLTYSVIALVIALPFSFFKVVKRSLIVHNLTELVIYPGIAAIFVPLLSLSSALILLLLISIYDIYAVWHSGFMQKMTLYQITKVGIFSGFFIPYFDKKYKLLLAQAKSKKTKIKARFAMLGGGDVVFPMILAGVLLQTIGLIPALFVVVGATLSLLALLLFSQKGKFYPAMPFLTAGCLLALFIWWALF